MHVTLVQQTKVISWKLIGNSKSWETIKIVDNNVMYTMIARIMNSVQYLWSYIIFIIFHIFSLPNSLKTIYI